jgi:phosphoribosylformylglycinamidine synthase subunit PurSL
MAEETGVKVYLDKVPLKYAGLTYAEIWISESQERMLLAVPPHHLAEFLAVCNGESAEATVIGEFTDDKKLRLYYQDNLVADLPMAFLHGGRPGLDLTASWQAPASTQPVIKPMASYNETLLSILGAWNTCSKEGVIRQYDHEVQGGSVLKPLVGALNDGPGDAAIIRPVLDSMQGLIIACGISPRYGDLDPYWMAASAIDEALRQVIAVGGSLDRVALLDNFCWGSVREPHSLGGLIMAARACYDMAVAYGTPFVSGKDSLNNEYAHEGQRISIPPTLLVSAMAVMPDTTKAISMDFKTAGDLIYLLGQTYDDLGGSEYYAWHGALGQQVPRVWPEAARKLMISLSQATSQGLVRACHDLSEGGLGVSLAEMAFAGRLGASVSLGTIPIGAEINRDDTLLFAESNSRFLAEVRPDDRDAFEAELWGNTFAHIGEVTSEPRIIIKGLNDTEVVNLSTAELKEAWQKPLRW